MKTYIFCILILWIINRLFPMDPNTLIFPWKIILIFPWYPGNSSLFHWILMIHFTMFALACPISFTNPPISCLFGWCPFSPAPVNSFEDVWSPKASPKTTISGAWSCIWLVVWNMFYFSRLVGISQSQRTNSIIFQRGRPTTNQKMLLTIINHHHNHY